ncbi:RNA 2',3'-cyclic phosphodiesterase [Nocardioides sp. SYSU DS0651]|uniref:RNA 2',3'-cyclic phosphodiesterase n=1 Tax=Nocardioides sp. SYSU DS0651 TaxID=3415955 RepID=UPI003F4BCEA4
MVRLFAAVVPPEDAVEHLDGFLEPRRSAGDFRWTRPEQFHVTLAFMADVAELRIEEYVDRLAASLDGLPTSEVRLGGAVTFPDPSRARVLAVSVRERGAAALERAAVRARNAAVTSGIEVDGQRFRPHLTIARTGGRPVEMTSWVRLLDGYEGPAWSFDGVQVIASHLGEGPRRSPRYETLATIGW